MAIEFSSNGFSSVTFLALCSLFHSESSHFLRCCAMVAFLWALKELKKKMQETSYLVCEA